MICFTNCPRKFKRCQSGNAELYQEAPASNLLNGSRIREEGLTETRTTNSDWARSCRDDTLGLDASDETLLLVQQHGQPVWIGTEKSKGTTMTSWLCLHPDDRERVLGALQDALTQEKDYNIDFPSSTSEQGIRWASSKPQSFTDGQNGKPIRCPGCTWTITERKQS